MNWPITHLENSPIHNPQLIWATIFDKLQLCEILVNLHLGVSILGYHISAMHHKVPLTIASLIPHKLDPWIISLLLKHTSAANMQSKSSSTHAPKLYWRRFIKFVQSHIRIMRNSFGTHLLPHLQNRAPLPSLASFVLC